MMGSNMMDRGNEMKKQERRCVIPWAVCPVCLGQGLSSSGRASWCPRCFRRWTTVEVEPCPWPAEATVTDVDGVEARVCRSHLSNPRIDALERRTDGGAVERIACGRCGRAVKSFAGGTGNAFEMHRRECPAPHCSTCGSFHDERQGEHPDPELAAQGFACPDPIHARVVGAEPRCKACGRVYGEPTTCGERFHARPSGRSSGAKPK
jgi:hypothetical protein